MTVDQIVGLLDAQGALSSAMTRATRQSNLTFEERRSARAKAVAEYRAKLADQIGADRVNALRKGNYGQLSMFLKLDVPPPKN